MRATELLEIFRSTPKFSLMIRDTDYSNPDRIIKEIDLLIKESVSSKWFRETEGGTIRFYRGLDGLNAYRGIAAFVKGIRKDRKPKDSSRFEHSVFNRILDVAGAEANRSNSIFITSNENFAKGYGVPWVVLPVGEYSYAYNPNIADWTTQEFAPVRIQSYLKRFAYSESPIINKDSAKKIAKILHSEIRGIELAQLKRVLLANDFTEEQVEVIDTYIQDSAKKIVVDEDLEFAGSGGAMGVEVMLSAESYLGVSPNHYTAWLERK